MSDEIEDDLFASQPNDAFFKGVFSNPAHAAVFFQSHVSPALAAAIDWTTIAAMPASFVRQDLQQSHSDLLYTVRCADHDIFLYLLFEHQTSVDPLMPLRLLDYVTKVLVKHAKEHGPPLPPVIPFVLHQGPERWTISPQFEHLFELPLHLNELLLPYLPKFRHDLLDLSSHDPDGGEHHMLMRVILNLMKAARAQRMMEFFEWLGKSDAAIALKMDAGLLRFCMVYAWNADTSLDVEAVSRHLMHQPELNEAAMTTAQYLRTQGREQGLQEGRREGIQEGSEKGLWIGKVTLLEELMGRAASDTAELATLPVDILKQRFATLEAAYQQKFKGNR
ncbi:MAG: Rpn family recombination-promoting nuclease/putative transposase [Verrucomicrobiaceae bacterium]|nr:Rpn family recombination-promoting nuclease/putative transposase [Verrucomicrobiaceae bacterium]